MQTEKNAKRKRILNGMKVALVEDTLTVEGGSQRVLHVLHDMWPTAPVFTSLYFPEKFKRPLDGWDIRTGWVSKLPWTRAFEQQYKMFQPLAFEMFDFTGYDLVVSQTYTGYSKGIIVPPECLHVCYVDTVPRFLWGYRTSKHERLSGIYRKLILPPIEHLWRVWDRQSSLRPDMLLANSENIARRIRKHWKREAHTVYPPADIERLLTLKVKKQDYFIYFGRLETYKCVDMAIRACCAASQKLHIVGTGTCEDDLKSLVKELKAEKLVSFVGWLSRPDLDKEIAESKGFIFPGPDEDFGLVMVEALAAGTPVIAFNRGGAAEIVEDGVSGVLVGEFSQEALNKAVEDYDPSRFNSDVCRKRSRRFSVGVFKGALLNCIESLL
jgi:glycosyltransferase involved in cell wall biosynthesis